jgi:hypothetical protein
MVPRPAVRRRARGALQAGRIGQSMRRDAVNGVEQERLKQALDCLIDAQREALDVIAEQSEPDVGGLEEDEQLLVGGHLEAALEEVRAILEGAQEDVRGIVMRCRRPSPVPAPRSPSPPISAAPVGLPTPRRSETCRGAGPPRCSSRFESTKRFELRFHALLTDSMREVRFERVAAG